MPSDLTEVQRSVVLSSSPAEEFLDLAPSRRRELFYRLPEAARETVVSDMDADRLRSFVGGLDPDEATDVLALADETTRETVLRMLDDYRRDKVRYLLEFSPESAAGVMSLDYVTLDAGSTVGEAAERVRRHEERTGKIPTVFVTDGDELLGTLPGASLAAEDETEGVAAYVRETPTVRPDASDTDIIEVLRANPESEVAVVDDEGVLGVVHAEDLLRIAEEEAGETLYEFTGVSEGESALDGPLSKVRSRYKWLVINLGTAFLAAGVVGLFEDTIAALTLLAVYMPVVAGMGGNAGTQSMAVTVRGITLGQVSLETGGRVVLNEVIAGAANGAITGLLVAAIASVFNQSPLLGIVLGVSMVLNLVIAGLFGSVIPLVLSKLGQDPATSATIFITTATDVLGFFVFLGLAKLAFGI